MSGEWHTVLMLVVAGGSFLWGRWCGIRDYERALEDSGILEPREEDK